MTTPYSKVVLLSGTTHPDLSEGVAECSGIPLSPVEVGKFANGETKVEVQCTVRGADCYIIAPICAANGNSLNDSVMELLITISALRGSSAERVSAVMPMYGYARQDKKDKSRAAITARLFGDLLITAGVDRIITVDLHSSQIQGFCSKPMDNLFTEDLLTDHIREQWGTVWKKQFGDKEVVVVSPDAGGAKRASRVAYKLGQVGQDVDCAIISKERIKANEVSSMRLVGNVADRICVIVDDMADTCGTLVLAAETLYENGASAVHAYIAHGLFSHPAIDRINKCDALKSVVCTNTLPQKENQARCAKLEVVDIAGLLAACINCCHNHTSITDSLFASTSTPKSEKYRELGVLSTKKKSSRGQVREGFTENGPSHPILMKYGSEILDSTEVGPILNTSVTNGNENVEGSSNETLTKTHLEGRPSRLGV